MRVLLVGNYSSDKQESMQRYAEMVRADLAALGVDVRLIRPHECLGRLKAGETGWGKWLGYVDKFIIFPHYLRMAASEFSGAIVHICDHSNAMYTEYLQDIPHLVTCHDVLAIGSALGKYPQNPTKWPGRLLQLWIRSGLRRAARVICDSDATRGELLHVEPSLREKVATVYPNLNYGYVPMTAVASEAQLRRAISGWRFSRGGYLFHVGGNQWYKNREGLLRIYFAYIDRGGRLPLVVAGKSLPASLRELISNAPTGAEVVTVDRVDNATLNALYADAAALVFPSLYEGFGWPVLEAFAVGCPVVCSNRGSLPEVGGEAAIYLDPADARAAAEVIGCALELSPEELIRRRKLGFEQVARFSHTSTRLIIANYELVLHSRNRSYRQSLGGI